MENENFIIDKLKKQGMLPLFYHTDKEVCVQVAKILYDEGVRAIEFTNRGENALENFKRLISERNESMNDLLLGAGTIRSSEQAMEFIKAGADFLVSPVFDSGVCDVAYMHKLLWIPGCMTPTEIHYAEISGCKLVKLFPGNLLGPAFVKGVKELFPKMEFMPTGGVEVDKKNLEEWFDAGVSLVGLGSKLISKKDLDKKNYDKIRMMTKKAFKIIHSIKSSK
jgi:2-dehydro-3-deoxyphosphogluconate aldolase/(4S)-4-hydroxy-2-oxoglutarate aldolase